MPRDCHVCRSQDRARIEEALARGATFVAVSRQTRFSQIFPDAIERHWHHHVAPELRDARNGSGAGVITIASHMVDLLHATQDVRRRAIAEHRDPLAVRAIREEREIVLGMADRLGIRGDQALDEMRRLSVLSEAVTAVIARDPNFAETVAAELERRDHPEDAAGLRVLAYRTTDQREVAR